MTNNRRGRDLNQWKTNRPAATSGKLRIVGGKYRGRQIAYSGDPVTRPMKDFTREALFNLVGGWVSGKACFDLFAGTGAVGIEALSRGAERAIMVERHFPTVKAIKENVA
jgi:16S rRNA (guanine966-N2)-methyltransferase